MSDQNGQSLKTGTRKAAPSAVKSASRTLDVLELLSDGPGHRTLAEMATALQVPKSSLHAILRTMQARGWVETDNTGTRYGLGVRALRSGTAYVDGDDIVALTASVLDRLAAETGETVHLGRLDGVDIVYLAKRESAHAVRLYSAVGRRLPAHATALGKALLAAHGPDEVDRRLNWPLSAMTPTTITDPRQFHAELQDIRSRGYAMDEGENTPDIRCTAVALTQPAPGTNALSCSVPRPRASDERMAELTEALIRAARDVDVLAQRLRTR